MTELSALCVRCGLCCDGTVFSFLAISEAEADAVKNLPVRVDRVEGRTSLRLGCTALQNRCCTIYEARPSGCREFVCAVGKDLEAGKRTFDESLGIIRDLQARVRSLGQALDVSAPVMPTVRDTLARSAPHWNDEQLEQARATNAAIRTTLLGWS